MFCKKCGKEVNDDAVVCIHCGCAIKEDLQQKGYDEAKTGVGVAMAIFLGLIGLIIGVCIYPAGTIARKTFVKGFWITFGISAVVLVLFYGIIFAAAMSSVPTY